MILPDVRGLYRFYEELALRFAERGYAAVAFDYFGRTAGAEKRDDDFEYMPHVQQTTPEGVQADVGACVDAPPRAGCETSSPSGSASAGATRGLRPHPATGSPARSASTDGPARAATAHPDPPSAPAR